jgi:ABC-type phosphate transport system substrate-binding protein
VKISRLGSAAALAAVTAIALSSCAANEAPAEGGAASQSTLEGTLNGIGASSQGSAQEAWIAAFQTANSGVTLNYSPDGSGAGREAFMAGGQNANFAGSDRALKTDELSGTFGQCADGTKPIDVPAYISPIAMIFKIDGVDELNLDPATAAGIFKGTITKWNDPAITALNPDATLPDAAITAVHRSDDSGTTENFARYLNTTAKDVWDAEPKGVWPYQGGEAAQGTSGVVDAVTGGMNIIGYADASRAGTPRGRGGHRRGIPRGRGPRGERRRLRPRLLDRRRRRLPDRPRQLPHRLPGVQGPGRRRARQGLSRLRDQHGRPGARRREGRRRAAVRHGRRAGQDRGRVDQVAPAVRPLIRDRAGQGASPRADRRPKPHHLDRREPDP